MNLKKKSYITETTPPGFCYFPDFISVDEEKKLLEEFSLLHWQDIFMYGVKAKRQVIHYGMDYNYKNRSAVLTEPPPLFLNTIIKRASKYLKVPKTEIKEILLTKYPVGAGIGWHKDALVFGDSILGISLNNDCLLKLRKKNNEYYEVFTAKIAARSAYILSGPARTSWQHSIPAIKAIRYSITLRTLA